MKTKSLSVLILLLFFISITTAQEFKLGKVSVAELEEKFHPKDSSAVAAILFKKGEVKFEYSQEKGFEMVTQVKTRVKIYKKEGYEWANQVVQYYIGNNLLEVVSFTDALTYNLVGGKIEKTKLKNEGEFDEKINKYWSRKKIVMPNVKEGSVIEYEYTIKTPRIDELKEWFFQSSIPVNYSEFVTHIPEYFVYNPKLKGYIFPKVTGDKITRRLSYTYTDNKIPGVGGKIIPDRSQEDLEFMETKTTYLAENIPAIEEEVFVNNIYNYTASVSHELAMTNFPNSKTELYSTDWESVSKKIYDDQDFGAELNKTGYFEEDITALIKGFNKQEEKISAILNFVKTKVKWNDYNGYSCNDGVKKAYKYRIGNVAEINLMLTAMLRFAEIKANPVLISTRSNGIALFPSRTGFNYVITAIETLEGLVLLDATEIFSTPNVLPLRDLNWFGRLIRKDGTSTQIDLMPKVLSKESATMNFVLNNEGTIEGKIRKQYTNHNALQFRKDNSSIQQIAYLENLENKNNSLEIEEYNRTNELDLTLPLTETFSFKSKTDVEIIDDKLYLAPVLFLKNKENPFKQDIREYPIDFSYPFESKTYIDIDIPQGYKVEFLPKSSNLIIEDNLGSFNYVIENSDDNIKLMITTTINTAIIPSEYYEILKNFYQAKISKENEKIILSKIQ